MKKNHTGFSVKMNMDDTEAIVVVRAESPMTVRDFVEALEDIALQYREEAEESWDGDH